MIAHIVQCPMAWTDKPYQIIQIHGEKLVYPSMHWNREVQYTGCKTIKGPTHTLTFTTHGHIWPLSLGITQILDNWRLHVFTDLELRFCTCNQLISYLLPQSFPSLKDILCKNSALKSSLKMTRPQINILLSSLKVTMCFIWVLRLRLNLHE